MCKITPGIYKFKFLIFQVYLLFILIAFGFWGISSYYSYFKEVLAFGCQIFIVSTLITVFTNLKVKKRLICFFYSLLALLLFIKLSFYQLYDAKINASALYVIFETNMSETVDFIKHFTDGNIILLFTSIFLPLLIYLKLLFSNKFDNEIKQLTSFYFKNYIVKIGVVIVCFCSGYMIYSKFQDENILLETYNSFQDYNVFKDNMKKTLAKETTENVKVTQSVDNNQTYVVVIGESTSRWHMQLYGYNRETNPLLTELKDELYVFNDVISPHTHTMASLEKVLTLSSYLEPDKKNNASIVQLANQAGFTTFWLSNQRPVGIYESFPTMIGSAAKHKYFVNSDDFMYNVYDEKLLPYLDKILSGKQNKKMIFIHLMGTHNNYSKRYPDEFDYFTGVNKKNKFQHIKSENQVNTYDNAVRYNDFIIKSIIDKVKATNTNSYVVYFSDHGEDVYDTLNLAGHNEYQGTKPMYEIPFIVWLSEKYREEVNPIFNTEKVLDRSYNLENFIHSFSDLSKIKFKEYDSNKSIFSDKYLKSKRLIKGGIDYDKE
jgi:heptose-I-phosphate ethanolaminephosphotransferase